MTAERVHYSKLLGLKDVYLEDSYVLGISEDGALLRLTLHLVLCEKHPSFKVPLSMERYCYRLGVLEFRNVTAIEWHHRSKNKYRDADGRVDYGNVDVFYREGEGTYHLEGDWGIVDVTSSPPVIRLT